jgi:hypothetical protein
MNPENKSSVRAQMFHLIQQCQESNKNNRDFCREHGLRESIFYYWLKRYKESQLPATGFIPVKINGSSHLANDKIEIQYPNGVYLSLPGYIDINRIKALIGLK